jgi:hypothetical protein
MRWRSTVGNALFRKRCCLFVFGFFFWLRAFRFCLINFLPVRIKHELRASNDSHRYYVCSLSSRRSLFAHCVVGLFDDIVDVPLSDRQDDELCGTRRVTFVLLSLIQSVAIQSNQSFQSPLSPTIAIPESTQAELRLMQRALRDRLKSNYLRKQRIAMTVEPRLSEQQVHPWLDRIESNRIARSFACSSCLRLDSFSCLLVDLLPSLLSLRPRI